MQMAITLNKWVSTYCTLNKMQIKKKKNLAIFGINCKSPFTFITTISTFNDNFVASNHTPIRIENNLYICHTSFKETHFHSKTEHFLVSQRLHERYHIIQ